VPPATPGQTSPRAAMIYQHAAEDRDRAIAEGLAAMTVEAGLATVVPINAASKRSEADSR
jgi:hypothetical protein